MAPPARKRARTAGEDGGSENEGVAVADGFEAPLFGARVVGQVTTLPLEGEDGSVPGSARRELRRERSRGRLVRHHC